MLYVRCLWMWTQSQACMLTFNSNIMSFFCFEFWFMGNKLPYYRLLLPQRSRRFRRRFAMPLQVRLGLFGFATRPSIQLRWSFAATGSLTVASNVMGHWDCGVWIPAKSMLEWQYGACWDGNMGVGLSRRFRRRFAMPRQVRLGLFGFTILLQSGIQVVREHCELSSLILAYEGSLHADAMCYCYEY